MYYFYTFLKYPKFQNRKVLDKLIPDIPKS